MKKIGIVTHYYLSNNFGGNLQAYALATFINNLEGFEAEQISYAFGQKKQSEVKKTKTALTKKEKIKLVLFNPMYCFRILAKKAFSFFSLKNNAEKVEKYFNSKYSKEYEIRNNAIRFFNQNIIPHSEMDYYIDDIDECKDFYDIFITGSDQVWSGIDYGFSLRFAKDKTKISYAASAALKDISQQHKDYLKGSISDYKAISVRNENDKRIISELTDKAVETVLDPVFLLDENEWNNLITNNGVIPEKYVFCYFLGDNKKQKKFAKRFAKERGLKTVIIPHFKDNLNGLVFNDFFYGDYKPYNISPSDFIGLIKKAEYVFTDSFHAIAFSIIFQKQFFAFERVSKYGNMNLRLTALLEHLGMLDHYLCEDKDYSINNQITLDLIDYTYCEEILSNEREYSKSFLIDNLKD